MNRLFNYFISILIVVALFVVIFYGEYYVYIESFLWAITTVCILFVGINLSIKNKFIQLHFGKIIKSLFGKNFKNTLSSLSITLGAKIGVGSLAGISIALYYGGAGTIFWLCISSIIVSINTYAEVYLALKYNKCGKKIRGPSKYIYYGLNNKYLAILYSVIILVAYVFGFIPIQANTIVKSFSTTNIDLSIVVLSLVIISSMIILRNTKYIVKTCTLLVPFMTILYFGLGMYIIISNYSLIPGLISLIFKEGLTIRGILPSIIIIGIERGLFATEAGIGTGALSVNDNSDKKTKVALSQVFGIYVTTFIICTMTAFIILTSDYGNLALDNVNGIEIINYSFNYHLGNMGSFLLIVITILFAISTIISGYYYGEVSIKNIFPNISNRLLFIFKIITILFIYMGATVDSDYIWNTIDIIITFMAIINIYAIWRLRREVKID